MLRSLKMHGMAQAVGELTEQGSPAFEAALPILSQLLKAETADREVRSTAYQLKAARFPNYRDLAGFDFASSEVNEALVRQLHRCEFLEDAHNVVLVGGPGTGKTHLATAIGVQAIEHHRKRVRFFSTVELVNALEQEKLQGKARPDRGAARPLRSRHPRRTWLPAVQRLRRRVALPSAEQALRAHQRHHHDQSQLRRMGNRVRRPEDDDRAARSSHPPLPHPRNRKRQLPLQEQLGESRQTRKGETSELDERLTPKPSSSRVSSQWKSRVKSRRKSTGDLYPTGSLRWNWGVNNVMTYLTGDIPVGLYNSQQLATLGIGHGAIDAGAGYTYFDQQTGHEFSVVIGATYNLINPSTQYQNGIDGHLDWGASQFLREPSSRCGRLCL